MLIYYLWSKKYFVKLDFFRIIVLLIHLVINYFLFYNYILYDAFHDMTFFFETFKLGSALKFCLIAEGIYHYYPKFGRCSEWDTAAGVFILEGAGGKVVDLDNKALKYNLTKDIISPSFRALA